MDRVKLADKTYEELNELRLSIETNPANKATGDTWYLHKLEARRKLEDIAWAITNKIWRDRAEAQEITPEDVGRVEDIL